MRLTSSFCRPVLISLGRRATAQQRAGSETQALPRSSLNIQATHYLVTASPAARARVAKAVENGFELNYAKILTASHVIVFCSRVNLPAPHMDEVAAEENDGGRFPSVEIESRRRELVDSGLLTHEYDLKDLSHWIEKQTYLAVGIALMTAAELGIHALPIALGRQSTDDYIVGTPKSRTSRIAAIYRPRAMGCRDRVPRPITQSPLAAGCTNAAWENEWVKQGVSCTTFSCRGLPEQHRLDRATAPTCEGAPSDPDAVAQEPPDLMI
jgi:nitroreductase